MKNFEQINHTADVEFEIHGKSLKSLFINALMCMFDVIADVDALKKSGRNDVKINVADNAAAIEDLLWYSLQDAFSSAEAGGLFCYAVVDARFVAAATCKAHFTILCKKKSDAHARLSVKGVSRYDMSVEKKGGQYCARMVLDV